MLTVARVLITQGGERELRFICNLSFYVISINKYFINYKISICLQIAVKYLLPFIYVRSDNETLGLHVCRRIPVFGNNEIVKLNHNDNNYKSRWQIAVTIMI